MAMANTTDKKITTPNAALRCCALAGMLAIRAGPLSPRRELILVAYSFGSNPHARRKLPPQSFVRPNVQYCWAQPKSGYWNGAMSAAMVKNGDPRYCLEVLGGAPSRQLNQQSTYLGRRASSARARSLWMTTAVVISD
jgi:hypothetical protein